MKRRAVIITIALVAALLCGLLIFIFRNRLSSTAIRPRLGPVVEGVYGLGTVVAPQTFQLKSAVSQNIETIFVKEGDQVRAGDPLVRFDDSGVSRAPFAGTITSIPLKKGELLFPSTLALTLVNLNDLILEVSLEQQAVLKVKKGQTALVSFESLRENGISAKVQSVFPRETQFIVRIAVDQFPKGILPGMTADVAIEVDRKENALSIPLRAISAGKVSVRRDGKTIRQTVQVGAVDGEWAEVTSGNILASDEVLVRPN